MMSNDLTKLSQQELIEKVKQLECENALLKQKDGLIPINDLEFNFNDIVAIMPGNIFWKQKDGKYLGCNKNLANFLGFKTPEEIIGKRNSDFMPEDVARALDQIDQEIYAEGGKYIEESGMGLDKQLNYFLTHKIPLRGKTGTVVGIFGISLNITELKKVQHDLKLARDKAEAASQAKSEFVANMSHDVKTPLAGIIGLAELLTYRLKVNENLEFANSIQISGQQLLQFFDNCLEIFKLESEIGLKKEAFDLKALTHDVIELFKPSTKSKGLTLNLDYPSTTPEHVIGNRAGIFRVLLNLIGNAVKFTHEGSIKLQINLRQRIDQDSIILQFIVVDTGIGIPRDKQDVIFDRFTRLTPSYKGLYEGSGIGLYIVQRYVSSMNGHINIQSHEGQGSEFSIEIPLSIAHAPPTKETKISQNKNASSHQMRDTKQAQLKVLLVEDNPTAQLIENSLLTALNCHVELAPSGETALEMFIPGKYDLIFMDIGLPGLQGDAVSKQIKASEAGTQFDVPIIALTAHTTPEMNQELLISGIKEVLSKPLSREHARAVIEKFCLE